jgi:hypothetical protein
MTKFYARRAHSRLAVREDYENEHAPKETKKAAAYARFSTDLQNERLIEDWACIMAKKASKAQPRSGRMQIRGKIWTCCPSVLQS